MKKEKGPGGRPRQRWAERVKTDLTEISEKARIEDSDDRDRWRGLVEEAKSLNSL